MSKWQERINEMQEELKEVESWIGSFDWNVLPQGVRMAIVRGQMETEKRIEKYKILAEKDSINAEQSR